MSRNRVCAKVFHRSRERCIFRKIYMSPLFSVKIETRPAAEGTFLISTPEFRILDLQHAAGTCIARVTTDPLVIKIRSSAGPAASIDILSLCCRYCLAGSTLQGEVIFPDFINNLKTNGEKKHVKDRKSYQPFKRSSC